MRGVALHLPADKKRETSHGKDKPEVEEGGDDFLSTQIASEGNRII